MDNAGPVVERLQVEVSNIAYENNWPITVSMGVVTFNDANLLIDEMIKHADDLMCQVKKEGKNNVKFEFYPAYENEYAEGCHVVPPGALCIYIYNGGQWGMHYESVPTGISFMMTR